MLNNYYLHNITSDALKLFLLVEINVLRAPAAHRVNLCLIGQHLQSSSVYGQNPLGFLQLRTRLTNQLLPS